MFVINTKHFMFTTNHKFERKSCFNIIFAKKKQTKKNETRKKPKTIEHKIKKQNKTNIK